MDDTDKKKNLDAKNTQTLIEDVKDDEVIEQQRKIFSLIQEKNELQQMLENITVEKEQLKTDLKENIEMVGFSTVYWQYIFIFVLDFYQLYLSIIHWQ